MIDPFKIIKIRKTGEIKFAFINDYSDNMDRVLARFGLFNDHNLLIELNRDTAQANLTALLWKDMVYKSPCMPEEKAKEIAQEIISKYGYPDSKYYSNGNWAKAESWNPLTESTFDGGLIITGPNHIYFCIWFQDED